MQNIKITVLIAIYNAEKYLNQCLDSLRQQTLQECEFLCIDDCSTDSSVSIIKSYVASDSRFKLMHTPVNSGQAVARNLGLACATGEYVTMLDADDWFAPDTLEAAYNVALDNDFPDTVLFRLMMVDETTGNISQFPISVSQRPLSGQEAFRLSLDWQLHGYYIIRRDIHIRYPYDGRYNDPIPFSPFAYCVLLGRTILLSSAFRISHPSLFCFPLPFHGGYVVAETENSGGNSGG